MEVMDAIKKRRSIRRYEAREVEEEKIRLLLEAARLAPSARNLQPWKFVVVKDRGKIEKLSRACCNQEWIKTAPLIIVGCGLRKHTFRNGYPSNAVDLAIALEHIVLEAVELGLGTCWIEAFYPDEVRKILGIPEDIDVSGILTVGYPAESPEPRERKSLEEIMCREGWC
ncbi:nitroreductase [bacterium]|nr:MAG: nitroreductase [bacterium]